MKLRLEEFKRTEEKPAMELFYDGIKADQTRDYYTRRLRYLLCGVFEEIFSGSLEERAKELVERSRSEPKFTVDLMLNFLALCRQRTSLPKTHPDYLSPYSVPGYLKPVKKLLDMNDAVISWKRIYAAIPEFEGRKSGRGYTREEIQTLLRVTANPADHAVILIAASSGIRSGAFEFRWGDVVPVYMENSKLTLEKSEKTELVCTAILIYKGSEQEYLAFITPEAHHALMEHRKRWMQQVGREPLPNDPVFKKLGRIAEQQSTIFIRERLNRLVRRSGVRPQEKKRRHEIPTMNGFRKFWNKTVKETESKDVIGSLIKKEYLMGHDGLVSLDKNYFQSSILELAEEYLTVVSRLTITDEFQLKAENMKLKMERDEVLELAKDAVDERNKAIEALRRNLRRNEFSAKLPTEIRA